MVAMVRRASAAAILRIVRSPLVVTHCGRLLRFFLCGGKGFKITPPNPPSYGRRCGAAFDYPALWPLAWSRIPATALPVVCDFPVLGCLPGGARF